MSVTWSTMPLNFGSLVLVRIPFFIAHFYLPIVIPLIPNYLSSMLNILYHQIFHFLSIGSLNRAKWVATFCVFIALARSISRVKRCWRIKWRYLLRKEHNQSLSDLSVVNQISPRRFAEKLSTYTFAKSRKISRSNDFLVFWNWTAAFSMNFSSFTLSRCFQPRRLSPSKRPFRIFLV